MHALIREYKGLDANTREIATNRANSELRPILTKKPGFVSYELIRPDNKDDMVTSISVFDTRAHAEESGRAAEEWVRTNLPPMTKPTLVTGELVAH